MSRVRVVIEVSDVDEAVGFYSNTLGIGPTDRGPASAEFLLEDPALRLVLTAGAGTVRSLGLEVETAAALDTVARRLRSGNVLFDGGEDATCCDDYLTDIWVKDPDGIAWEVAMPVGDGVDVAACRSACCAS